MYELIFVKNTGLWIKGIGTFEPGDLHTVETEDERDYLVKMGWFVPAEEFTGPVEAPEAAEESEGGLDG